MQAAGSRGAAPEARGASLPFAAPAKGPVGLAVGHEDAGAISAGLRRAIERRR